MLINLSDAPHHLFEQLSSLPPLPSGGRIFYFTEGDGAGEARLARLEADLCRVADHGACRRDVILMDRSTEIGRITPDRAAAILAMCKARDFPIQRFLYASQDRLAPASLAATFAQLGSPPPTWIWSHHYLVDLLKHHVGHADEMTGINRIWGDEPPRFLCLDHKVRPHRLAIAAHILDTPALAQAAHLSFQANRTALFGIDAAEREVQQQLPSFRPAVARQLEAVKALRPIHEAGARVGGSVLAFPTQAARSSMFVLAVESEYRSSTRVTEKTLKAVVYQRPFIIAGSQGALAEMRNMGFSTFGHVIDESYDDEPDHDRRLAKVVREVEALVNRLADRDYRRYFAETLSIVCETNRWHFDNGVSPLLQHRLENDFRALLGASDRGTTPAGTVSQEALPPPLSYMPGYS